MEDALSYAIRKFKASDRGLRERQRLLDAVLVDRARMGGKDWGDGVDWVRVNLQLKAEKLVLEAENADLKHALWVDEQNRRDYQEALQTSADWFAEARTALDELQQDAWEYINGVQAAEALGKVRDLMGELKQACEEKLD